MKRNMTLLIFLFAMILTSCGGEKVTNEDADKFIIKAEKAVKLLNKKKYEDLRQLFDRELRVTVTNDDLKNLEPLLNDSGEFVNIEQTSVERDNNDYLTILATKYSKEHRIFTIRFNRDVEIIDFLVQ